MGFQIPGRGAKRVISVASQEAVNFSVTPITRQGVRQDLTLAAGHSDKQTWSNSNSIC